MRQNCGFINNAAFLKELIRDYLNKHKKMFNEQYGYYKCDLSIDESDVNAVFARLFVLSYGDVAYSRENLKNSPIVSSRYDYVESILGEVSEESDKDIRESRDSHIRYNSARLIQYHNAEIEILNELNTQFPFIPSSAGKAIYHDKANFELLDDPNKEFRIVELIKNGKIKTAPLRTVAEAFAKIDSYYEKVKKLGELETNIQQKLQYIHKWINLYRMENKLHLSLVADFAAYCDDKKYKISVSEKEDGDYEIFVEGEMALWKEKLNIENLVCMYNTISKTVSDESGQGTSGMSEYHWWLPDDNTMLKYFNCKDRADLKYIIDTQYYRRILYHETVFTLRGLASHYFYAFMNGNETAVDFMYHFCKEDYPLIETHKPYALYKRADSKKNEEKIITQSAVTDIAKNFLIYFSYQNNMIPMEEIQNDIQKNTNAKYNKNSKK